MPFNRENSIIINLVWEATQMAEIRKSIPAIKKVRLWGSVGEIAVAQIMKEEDEDGRRIIKELFNLIPRAKGIIVVDQDIDIDDPYEVEWALFTRFQVDRDLLTISNVSGSVLDPSANMGITSKWGVDATKPLKETEKYERISPPAWAMKKVEKLLKSLQLN